MLTSPLFPHFEGYIKTISPVQVQNKQGKHIATLRADRRALYVQKSFPLNLRDKLTARIQATAATSYQGGSLPFFGNKTRLQGSKTVSDRPGMCAAHRCP